MTQQDAPRVALFVTCLADMFRPQVGFAAAKLLEQAGCTVDVPLQSCCGQPAYNGGDSVSAAAVARNVIGLAEYREKQERELQELRQLRIFNSPE